MSLKNIRSIGIQIVEVVNADQEIEVVIAQLDIVGLDQEITQKSEKLARVIKRL